MSTRRGFLKQALIVMAGATVVTPALTRAVAHIEQYHPEVQAVLDRFVDGSITLKQRSAVAKFVLSQIECGNWDLINHFYMFDMEDEKNASTNWKGKQ